MAMRLGASFGSVLGGFLPLGPRLVSLEDVGRFFSLDGKFGCEG